MTIPLPRLALLLVPLAAVACGGATSSSSHAGTAHGDARQAVLLSAQKASSTSFTMSMDMTEQISSAAGRALPTKVTLRGTGREESAQRSTFSMSIGVGSTMTINELVTAYDGTIYVSTDNGASWKTTTLNAGALTQQGPSQMLGYLSHVATVTDLGPTTQNGQQLEQYRATMDPVRTKAAMTSMFANVFNGTGLSRYASAITSALTVKTGTVTLTVNNAGLPVTESFDEDVMLDLSAFAAAAHLPASEMQGAPPSLDITMSGTCSFADFGGTVTVIKPANVTGPLTTPSLGG